MKRYDVVIVGAGAAGLYCALNLPSAMKVKLICKTTLEESDSYLAQGGICMLRGEEDFSKYFEDTLKAGHYENDPKSVDLMIRSSNSLIRDLISLGVDFTRDEEGNLAFTKEGAHSQPRILYHQDETGKEITSTLLEAVLKKDNVEITPNTTMIDLLSENNTVTGIVVQEETGNIEAYTSNFVVLACGGIGGLYEHSTNFKALTGDALAICKKHNVKLEHLDYIQIHPTTLYSKKRGRRFLLSESLRGEGALLLDIHGQRFTDELQPRDLLSQKIYEQMHKDDSAYVLEDLRPIGKEILKSHFPNICQTCLEHGYDVFNEPVPVVPAQHYFMGGIKVDLSSRTSMKNLYAAGETACNGVHGKNRLASNSLLETLVFARRAADDIVFGSHEQRQSADFNKEQYQDIDKILENYHTSVLEEIERMRNEHE